MFGDFDEVRGVGAVVSADDEHEVHGVLEHLEEGVLAFLCGAADGVKCVEVGAGAIACEDGALDALLDFLGFAFEHGGLVGDAEFCEMEIGVEAWGHAAVEAVEEYVFVAAMGDVLAEEIGIGEGEDDEVVAEAVGSEGA